jgi:glycosyltransferase involved in cell wall biosynthesis
MRLPEWVRTTGFVDAATRSDLLDAAEVVVLPSPHESLSLVALEAWRADRPTLAIAHSEVLAGQTARSGGGLLYLDAPTYDLQLRRLGGDPGLRARLGAAGRGWTADHTWDACAGRWSDLLQRVRAPLSPS